MSEYTGEYAIECHGITKSFGGVKALSGCDLKVKTGEIHAIIGENGAGKSTLMKIFAGSYERDTGEIRIFGRPEKLGAPKESQQLGIRIIYQEFSLVPDLTVAENIFLDDLTFGKALIDWPELISKSRVIIDKFGFDLDPEAMVGDLPVAWQQLLEITKALSREIRILILDEPTAVLAAPEVDRLFAILDQLRKSGVTILYISHRLEELFRISDCITVIKDGQTIISLDPKKATEEEVVRHMVGRQLDDIFPQRTCVVGEEIFRADHLQRGQMVRDVSFSLRQGEIVGMAGLMGAGRTEIVRAIFGADLLDSGQLYLEGRPIVINNPRESIDLGIGLIPEDRKGQGLVLSMPIAHNITMASMHTVLSSLGILAQDKERSIAEHYKKKLNIRMGDIFHPVESLSGGNQQKVVLARWLHAQCKVLFFDEPTRGVDVGAKLEIYTIITALAEQGVAVLVISSELPELLGLCDRILVVSDGELAGYVSGEDMTEEKIMTMAIPRRVKEKTGAE